MNYTLKKTKGSLFLLFFCLFIIGAGCSTINRVFDQGQTSVRVIPQKNFSVSTSTQGDSTVEKWLITIDEESFGINPYPPKPVVLGQEDNEFIIDYQAKIAAAKQTIRERAGIKDTEVTDDFSAFPTFVVSVSFVRAKEIEKIPGVLRIQQNRKIKLAS